MADDTDRIDPRLDLVLERTIAVPRALIWKVWTDPEHVKRWWAPRPWSTVECRLELRPGGMFRTVMRSPEGQDFPGAGCILELVENEKLVWTSALEPGYRPARDADADGGDCHALPFTAILTLAERGGRTHYKVRVLHKDEAGRKKHEEMGFHEGWNRCLDQLIEVATALGGRGS
jgi:uncharacterized protein YndB with AHSA1/START domain